MPSVPPVVEADVEVLDGGGELTLLVVVVVVVVGGGGDDVDELPSVHPIPYVLLHTLFGQENL
jgi:hypothetical protein